MADPVDRVRQAIESSIRLKQRLLTDEALMQGCSDAVERICGALRADRKVLFCGNGGSAADAQHLAAELSGRFAFDRPPLYAEALHVNTSFLTAVANDYGYESVFSRMLSGCGRRGDVLVGITTSGNSENVVRAAVEARRIGMTVISFTGDGGGRLRDLSDVLLAVPSVETARIQECHILLGHAICGLVEEDLFVNP